MIDKTALGLLLAGLLISTGCGSDKYPTEMSLEDAPETIAEAFKDEKNANIKAMATQATQLLKARNYTGAHGILKQLMSLPDLTPEQRDELDALFDEQRDRMRSLNEGVREQFRSAQQELRSAIAEILTAEQQERFAELTVERRERSRGDFRRGNGRGRQ